MNIYRVSCVYKGEDFSLTVYAKNKKAVRKLVRGIIREIVPIGFTD